MTINAKRTDFKCVQHNIMPNVEDAEYIYILELIILYFIHALKNYTTPMCIMITWKSIIIIKKEFLCICFPQTVHLAKCIYFMNRKLNNLLHSTLNVFHMLNALGSLVELIRLFAPLKSGEWNESGIIMEMPMACALEPKYWSN